MKIKEKRLAFEKKKKSLSNILTDNGSHNLITPERGDILSLSIIQLSEDLKNGRVDPVDVLKAYQVTLQCSSDSVLHHTQIP